MSKDQELLAQDAFIRKTHRLREVFFEAIHQADQDKLADLLKEMRPLFYNRRLGLLDRVQGSSLRSLKNLMLSHNSMMALEAERAGLDAALSHHLTEKFAVIIEKASEEEDLIRLHDEMAMEYARSDLRRVKGRELSPLVEAAVNFIDRYYSQAISIQGLAQHLYSSREYLSRSFQEEMGQSPSQYLQDKRLNEAKQLLRFSKLSIAEVATLIGYQNGQYFSRIFKEKVGCAPTKYREECHKSPQ
ncbi:MULTISPECIES: helix-turn-helix transcriptional regulator [Aerococcus]|uniref:Helix-turn-helix transcriptional regulator n=1 Tax=Aerococcus sanguinicola TaxID=119206 RepID=A0A5N1GGT9_9LACT|nr:MULTISPECIES: AraC family transcriptional regulator [Aerococcus]KAA9300187.1 helix-turn-helix transcriptional regulator [Aerococcus sanguinicola]MDK6369531.1 AraC family transcriptional regulator [Aerococcus sp. UMB9870]MDK6680019.1 AraC family transcriptional regulator [Aerococcus sp. UMB8608]MDK6686100.1 AraC family transcriptional regulator [Aerococcus sp. UMB8623]MDK6939880.1 AraC family transcriptional regulator [Aerococcus sp. UMB8487]